MSDKLPVPAPTVYAISDTLQFDLRKARRIAGKYATEKKRPSKSWLPFGLGAAALASQVILGTIFTPAGYKTLCLDGHGSVASALGTGALGSFGTSVPPVPVVTLSFAHTLNTLTGTKAKVVAQKMRRAVATGMAACAGCQMEQGAGHLWDF